jgi:putative glycosyltransferase (TIGR04372 family)
VPVAVANLFPVTMTGSGPHDVVWPKMLRRREDGRPVPFADVFRPPLLEQTFADSLDRLGIDVVDNQPDEIVTLVAEMYERVTGTWHASAADEELQARYKTLAPSRAVEQVGRMCAAFLAKHTALLPANGSRG